MYMHTYNTYISVYAYVHTYACMPVYIEIYKYITDTLGKLPYIFPYIQANTSTYIQTYKQHSSNKTH